MISDRSRSREDEPFLVPGRLVGPIAPSYAFRYLGEWQEPGWQPTSTTYLTTRPPSVCLLLALSTWRLPTDPPQDEPMALVLVGGRPLWVMARNLGVLT